MYITEPPLVNAIDSVPASPEYQDSLNTRAVVETPGTDEQLSHRSWLLLTIDHNSTSIPSHEGFIPSQFPLATPPKTPL